MGKQTGGSSEAMPLTSVSQLLAIESVRALKARYFRLMDMKLWDQWQALFAADAVMDVRGEGSALAALGFPEPDPSSLLWTGAGRIRDVRQSPDGFIYLVTDDRDGKPTPVLRLEPFARGTE